MVRAISSLRGRLRPAGWLAGVPLLRTMRASPVRVLVACGAAIVIAVVVAMGLILSGLRERALADSGRQLRNTSFILAEETDRALQALEQMQIGLIDYMRNVGVVFEDEFRWHMSGEDVHLLLKEKIATLPHVDAVTIIDTDGKLVNFSRRWPIPEVNVSDRDYFQALKANPQLQFYVSEPVLNRGDGTWTVYLARKVEGRNGEFLGLVLGAMQTHYFEDLFGRIMLGEGSGIALWRRDGMLLAHHPHHEGAMGNTFAASKPFLDLLGGTARAIRQTGPLTSEDRLIAGTPLAHFPMAVTASMRVDAVLAAWRTQVFDVAGLAGMLVLLVGGIGFVVVQRLREQHAQLDVALNNMRHGLLMFNAHGRLVVVNRRYAEMYGFAPDAVKPGCTVRELLEQRAAAGMFAGGFEAIDDSIANLMAHGHVEDKVTYLPDGRTVLVRNRLLAQGGFVSTHEDITDRTESEKALLAARAEALQSEQNARAAHARLLDAFEVVPEGLALFDENDRFALWNRRYVEMYRDAGVELAPGLRFEDMLRAGLARGQYPDAVGREEDWLTERLLIHARPKVAHVQHLADGRWLRIHERRTADGGSVGVSIDITELKRREESSGCCSRAIRCRCGSTRRARCASWRSTTRP